MNVYRIAVAIGIITLTACAASRSAATSSVRASSFRPSDDDRFFIYDAAPDSTYGYTQSNPIKVGGAGGGEGPARERRYLNGLTGPDGQQLSYVRAGSCCEFTTQNSPFGDTGFLDAYLLTWEGAADTLRLYLNMYDEAEVYIPTGLNSWANTQ